MPPKVTSVPERLCMDFNPDVFSSVVIAPLTLPLSRGGERGSKYTPLSSTGNAEQMTNDQLSNDQ